MKRRTLAAVVVCLTLSSTPPVGAATVGYVRAVGEDGNSYYDVRCSDGNRATLVVAESPREVCIYADHLGRSCRADWTVDNAAAFACRTAPPRGPDRSSPGP